MPLIKNGAAVQDPWFAATTEADLDRSGPLLVTLELTFSSRFPVLLSLPSEPITTVAISV